MEWKPCEGRGILQWTVEKSHKHFNHWKKWGSSTNAYLLPWGVYLHFPPIFFFHPFPHISYRACSWWQVLWFTPQVTKSWHFRGDMRSIEEFHSGRRWSVLLKSLLNHRTSHDFSFPIATSSVLIPLMTHEAPWCSLLAGLVGSSVSCSDSLAVKKCEFRHALLWLKNCYSFPVAIKGKWHFGIWCMIRWAHSLAACFIPTTSSPLPGKGNFRALLNLHTLSQLSTLHRSAFAQAPLSSESLVLLFLVSSWTSSCPFIQEDFCDHPQRLTLSLSMTQVCILTASWSLIPLAVLSLGKLSYWLFCLRNHSLLQAHGRLSYNTPPIDTTRNKLMRH